MNTKSISRAWADMYMISSELPAAIPTAYQKKLRASWLIMDDLEENLEQVNRRILGEWYAKRELTFTAGTRQPGKSLFSGGWSSTELSKDSTIQPSDVAGIKRARPLITSGSMPKNIVCGKVVQASTAKPPIAGLATIRPMDGRMGIWRAS